MALVVQYWETEEHGLFARVPEKKLCLSAETLTELASTAERLQPSEGVVLVPGDPLPQAPPPVR